jgi:hypothetical protein
MSEQFNKPGVLFLSCPYLFDMYVFLMPCDRALGLPFASVNYLQASVIHYATRASRLPQTFQELSVCHCMPQIPPTYELSEVVFVL